LPAKRVDAERLRRLFIFSDGLPVVPGARTQQPGAEREGGAGQREHHVIEHRRRAAEVQQIPAFAMLDLDEEPSRAPEPLDVIEPDPRELSKRDRQQREIDARDSESEREESDRCTEKHARRDRGEDARPWADPEVKIEPGGGVGAYAYIQRMPERKLP